MASTTASVPSVEPSLPTITSRTGLAGPVLGERVRDPLGHVGRLVVDGDGDGHGRGLLACREEAERAQPGGEGDRGRVPEVDPEEGGERDHESNGKQQHDARSVPARPPSCGRDGVAGVADSPRPAPMERGTVCRGA